MRLTRRTVLLGTAAALGVTVTAAFDAARAETDWPTQPITIIVPFSPGGGMDQTLLPLKPLLEERLGQPVLFDYKPGASSQIGAEFVHAMGEDGYVVGGMSLPHLTNTLIFSEPKYTLDDVAPVTIITKDVPIWFVHKDSPYQDMNDLIEAARENPGEVSLAIGSFTGEHYVTVAMLQNEADVEFNVVNVKGGAKVMSNVAGQHFDVGVSRPSSILPVQDQIRGIGIVAPERSPLFPETATFDEQLPDVEIPHLSSARGLYTHAAFKEENPEAFQKLAAAVEDALRSDEYQQALERMGLEFTYQGPEEATETVRETHEFMKQFKGVIEQAQGS